MAIIRVEKTKDYTVMSNYHFRDKSLSIKAMGLLSFCLSVPDDWDYSIAGLTKCFRDGVDSISATLNELEEHGYVTRKRIRNEKGQLKEIEYTIHEMPVTLENQEVLPKRENPGQADSAQEKPKRENPRQVNPRQEKPEQENPAQINTKRIDTETKEAKEEETKDINYHPKSTTGELSREERERYRRLLTEKLRPAGLKKLYPDSRKTIDSFFELAFRTVTSSKATIRIGGEELPADDVRQRLLSLTDEHLEQVLKAWEKNSTDVRNPRQYMLTMLYNAPVSIDAKKPKPQEKPVTIDELQAIYDRM